MKPAALVAASAVFFSFWATMAVSILSSGALGAQTVILALSLVSLNGTVPFLRAMRQESPRWFWGIPLAAVCTALVLWTGIVEWVVTVPDITNRAFLFLLPPAATLFLYSFPDDCRSTVRMPIAVSALVCVPSLILACSAFCTLIALRVSVPGFMGAAAVVYMLLLMPLVGVLLIVMGVTCR